MEVKKFYEVYVPEPRIVSLHSERRQSWHELRLEVQTSVSRREDPRINANICILRSTSALLPALKRNMMKNLKFQTLFVFSRHLANPLLFTFFRSLMDPLPNTDILHIVSSCSRFKELPFGPSSFPTKLNCKSQFKNSNNLVYLGDGLLNAFSLP